MPIELAQCRFEIGDQLPIGSLAGSTAGDDHVIGSRPALARQHFSRGRPQPPLGPVAGDGVAHPAARGEADPHRRSAVCFDRPRRCLQDKAGPRRPAASRGNTKKIGARLEPCKAGCHARHRRRRFGSRPGAMARPKQLRPTGACDLLRAAPRAPGGRQGSPCAHEIRGGACGRACWAGKCASRHRLQRRLPGLSGGRYIGERSGQVNDGPGWCSWRREGVRRGD